MTKQILGFSEMWNASAPVAFRKAYIAVAPKNGIRSQKDLRCRTRNWRGPKGMAHIVCVCVCVCARVRACEREEEGLLLESVSPHCNCKMKRARGKGGKGEGGPSLRKNCSLASFPGLNVRVWAERRSKNASP
jgi:hypothetical protein